MKSSHQIELTAGLFMLLAIAALIFLAVQATDRGVIAGGGYQVIANFSNVGGLKPRAKVAMGGVTIGQVESITLDPESFEARVSMIISDEFSDLPEDSSASILTSGILGDQFIGIEPGGSPQPLVDGDRLILTNSALQLEQLISRYLFNSEQEE